jgi:lipopolysaccharide export system permease protein
MRISTTLSVYVGRHFFAAVLSLLCLFLLLVFMFDAVELLRRAASKPNVSFELVMKMTLLKLPHLSQKILPFAVLFGGMVCFWRLTRSNELVVTRGAGVSAWQFLLPAIGLAVGLGVFQISVLNPLASTTLARFEQLEALHLQGNKSLLAVSSSGLWLRQANPDGQSVLHAKGYVQNGKDVELHNVTIFTYVGKDTFRSRISGDSAKLEDGFWHIFNAWIYEAEKPPINEKEFWLATDLTLDKIQDSFAPPETMSFWDLPGFIKTLEKAGFSAIRHRLHWHSLLAAPLLMCAMVLIGATFTLRHSRRGATTFVIAGGVFTGFALYFFSDVVLALGLSDSIPVTLAAWSPSGVAMLLGLTTLLHLEDG